MNSSSNKYKIRKYVALKQIIVLLAIIFVSFGCWDGKREGPYTEWHENGQKMREATYKDGKREGPSTWWYENGQKMREATYKDGKQVSTKKWDKEGNIIEEVKAPD